MKCAIIFAAIVAVSSAQFNKYGRNPFPSPTPFAPSYSPFSPSPTPFVPLPTPSRPVNRNSDQAANIINSVNDIGPDGSYNHSFDTDNGISAQAQGTPKNLGGNPPEIALVSQGSFTWTSPEGKVTYISYIADENGYQPTGDAIPTPPAIPEAILRSLEFNARNPQQQK